MCQVGEFNLSYESLTSSATRQLLRDLPLTDPEFFAELSKPRSRVPAPALSAEDVLHEDAEVSDVDVPGDDLAVPLEAVLDAMPRGCHKKNSAHHVRKFFKVNLVNPPPPPPCEFWTFYGNCNIIYVYISPPPL